MYRDSLISNVTFDVMKLPLTSNVFVNIIK